MSNTPRIDPSQSKVNVAPTVKHEGPRAATPFAEVMARNAVGALLTGAEVATGVLGGPVLAAAVREAKADVVSGMSGGGGGAGGSAAAAAAAGAASPDGGITQMHAMQRENQAFNLQLLALQQKVQTENQSTATVSALQKSSHDAKMEMIRKI